MVLLMGLFDLVQFSFICKALSPTEKRVKAALIPNRGCSSLISTTEHEEEPLSEAKTQIENTRLKRRTYLRV